MNQLWHLQLLPGVLASDWLVGQATTEPTWVTALVQMDVGKLAVLMIFGTGMIGAIGYTIACTVRAYNGTPDQSDSLDTRITALEQRLQQLEQRL